MKLLASFIAGVALIATTALAGEVNPADQKWLETAGKMVTAGKTEISTPSEARATLLKEWSQRHGYSVNILKGDAGFKIQVSKSVATL
jgi:hypothetical protein